MSTRQLNLSDFAAHCLEEMKTVQQGDTVIEVLNNGGKVIAVINPPPPESEGTLADWLGSGASLMAYGPGYDPAAPAFAPDDWEAFQEAKS